MSFKLKVTVAVAVLSLSGGVDDLWAERKSQPADVVAACGFAKLAIEKARLSEVAATCRAVADVVDYFARLGFGFEPQGTIGFGAAATEHGGNWFRSHGSFDAQTLTIRLTALADVSAWGLTASADLGASFLRHEVVYLAVRLILGDQSARVPRHWQEFIGYAVQLELMPMAVRESILRAAPDAKPFGSLLYVNEFLYGFDPEAFAVSAYRTYVEGGRGALVRQILSFELALSDVVYPASPILPGQVPGR